MKGCLGRRDGRLARQGVSRWSPAYPEPDGEEEDEQEDDEDDDVVALHGFAGEDS